MNIGVDSLTFRHSDSPIKSNVSMKGRNSAGCTWTRLYRYAHVTVENVAAKHPVRAARDCHGFPLLTPRGHLDIVDGKLPPPNCEISAPMWAV